MDGPRSFPRTQMFPVKQWRSFLLSTPTKIALALLVVLVAPAPSFARAAGQEERTTLPVSGSLRGHFATPSESRRHTEATHPAALIGWPKIQFNGDDGRHSYILH